MAITGEFALIRGQRSRHVDESVRRDSVHGPDTCRCWGRKPPPPDDLADQGHQCRRKLKTSCKKRLPSSASGYCVVSESNPTLPCAADLLHEK